MHSPNVITADMPLSEIIRILDAAEGTGIALTVEGANPDRFAELSWHFRQRGYTCVGQSEQPQSHHFIALDAAKQRIMVTATNDNLHFMQPVLRLMRQQGHYVKEIYQRELTENSLLNALRHCDVAWFEWGDTAIIAASHMPKYCRILCRIHSYELFDTHFLQANWKNVDEVILVSNAMKQRFVTQLGDKLPAELKITVLSNLSDHQPSGLNAVKKNPFHIACVARYSPKKNLTLLLSIMQALVKLDSRYKLFIAGYKEDSCLYDSFCHLIDVYDLRKNIVICGTIAAAEMEKWYATKSFILSASYIESQGMGIFEAMMAGLKPVAFPAYGGLTEYLPAEYVYTSTEEAVKLIVEGNTCPAHYVKHAQSVLDYQRVSQQYEKTWLQNSSTSPLFSIVIPCFNREAYLLAAVSSALNQRDGHFEVIVVDDGSTDNSLTALELLYDARLRIVRKNHTNAPDTRNRGILEAKGEYIVWLDSDDVLHENALTHYRSLLQRWPHVDVISCGLETLTGEKQYFSLHTHPPANILAQLPHGNVISNPGCCVRRAIYAEVGGYDITYPRAHDYEFWSRAVGSAKVAFTAQCNIAYRLHETNLTGLGKPTDKSYEYRIFDNVIKRYRAESLFPGIKRSAVNDFIQQRRTALYAETDVDFTTIVLNAIGISDDALMRQAMLLRSQRDKRFRFLVVSERELPFSGIPVLVADRLDAAKIKQYLSTKLPDRYHRCYVLAPDATENVELTAQLKKAILDNTPIPSAFHKLHV